MRIPFPQFIPLGRVTVFLIAVLFIQLIQGTDPLFAFFMLVAQVAAVVAFNILGGMTHMSGAFCLFALLPNVTVPELAHILLGQPGDYGLEHPLITAGVCALFFVCVMSAALLVSLSRRPEPYLDRISFSILELRIISALAAVLAAGITIAFFTREGPLEEGSLLLALSHFQAILLAMSIMLATHVRLTVTNGRSAMSWYIACLFVIAVIPGILGASKEGMLTPVFCWLLLVAAAGHRFKPVGVLMLLGLATLIWTFVYPFSTNARFPVREAATVAEKVNLIVQFIQDPSSFPDSIANADESDEFGTGTAKVNIVARYSLLKSIDMLIGADLRTGFTSIDRYLPVLVSVVPHALWPDRPTEITTNELGHKAGFLGDDDTETGIALGSPALFFDIGGWLALLVYTIGGFSLFFYLTVRLIGKTTGGVWALIPIGMEAHISGAATPASLVSLIVTFLGMFFVAVAILKMISYFTQTLISRPASFQNTSVR